ncbi:fused response regulator/phosphatase [Paenibacillus phoenicis]|uniref:Fused response regulator/phosphatase n=1 Tax=Paenibacillus phoenicis TaxID=554117 RepID=A0ABU5PMA7_9BACL|nr:MULTISPECIES: fused response regulator/phosphatase [Paenibacillus]MCT2196577.1 fused response regulator/phosphatase [Paenibacillus sp. p3-SID1389]MEA3571083.1 fused response regulator/phosphatase [Paenibacillus phoenicis]
MRILIVDDNPTNTMIIREILKKENYRNTVTVTSARDMFERLGVKNLDAVEESGPSDVDLILLDMMMPEMDGIQACRILQRSEHLKEIPIIVVTAVGDSHKLAEALDAGAVDYVTKPINKVELMARIRLALRLKLEKDWHRNRDQRIQEELKLASLVQNAVLSPPIHDSEVEIDALYKPSYELAGDLYSWYSLGEGKYAVILLDMMGHGISSSLFCMFISSVLKDTVFTYVEPKLVIEELNRRFIQLHIESKLIQYYFTAIYLVVDTRRKVIEYVNAGHPPALLYTNNKQPVRLDQVGPPVGLFDGIETHPQILHYEGPGHLVLYTDGLMDGQEDSLEARQAWLEEQLNTCSHHFDREMMSRLFFEDAVPLNREDDKCLVWISFK